MYAPYLTPETEEYKMKVREWAEKELPPLRDKYEEMNIDGLGTRFPWEVYRKIGGRGLIAEHVPKEYGGKGESFVTEIITIEEISRVCPTFGLLADYTATLVCNPILIFGTEEQKKKYLPPLVRGEKIGSFALTEPMSGSDVALMESLAERRGDEYVIKGHKKFIFLGNLADVLLVFAKTKPEAGIRGITAFILEKDMEGISYPKVEKKMGLRTAPASEIKFEKVRVSADNILGGQAQENRGIYQILDTLDQGRTGIAAQAVGTAQAALEQATRFAAERVQFGQPIINSQAIQWMIADMAMKIDSARLLTYRAAYLRDLGIKGKIDRRIATCPVSMAKCFSTEVATFVTHRAIQIFGGRGYMMDPEYVPIKELPHPEKLYRDCRVFEIYEGTSEMQRMIIARDIMQRYPKK